MRRKPGRPADSPGLKLAKRLMRHYIDRPLHGRQTERTVLDALMLQLHPTPDADLLALCAWLGRPMGPREVRIGRAAWMPQLRELLKEERDTRQRMVRVPPKG